MSVLAATTPQWNLSSFPQTHTEMNTERYRLLITSGQALFRESLKSALEGCPECAEVLEASNPSTALQVVEEHAVDIVLLDYESGGHLVLRFLTSPAIAEVGVPVLVLSGLANGAVVNRMLIAGAAGVVWKRSSMRDLKAGIRAALERKHWRDCGALRPRGPSQNIARPAWGRFTERQMKVIQGVLQGRANKEIAGDLSVTESSVKCTVRQLFSKTNTHSRAQIVRVLMEQRPAYGLDRLESLP